MDNLVDGVGGDSGLEGCCCEVEDFSCKTADLAHTLLLSLVEDGDLVPAHKDLFGSGDTISGVIGTWDVCGHFAAGREGVQRPQGTRVWEGREGVVLAGGWVWFRNDTWNEEIAERITCGFVRLFVITLEKEGN